jgi:hypothetical protein
MASHAVGLADMSRPAPADNSGPWMCVFALDIYDWKDLGRTSVLPARGCAGFYMTPAQTIPATQESRRDARISV